MYLNKEKSVLNGYQSNQIVSDARSRDVASMFYLRCIRGMAGATPPTWHILQVCYMWHYQIHKRQQRKQLGSSTRVHQHDGIG